MYIHYAIIDLPKGKFVQLKFCSNEFPTWSITENKNVFFVSKQDWNLVAAPLVTMIKQIPSTKRVWDAKNYTWTIPEDVWQRIAIVAKNGLGCKLKEHKNLYQDFIYYNPQKPIEAPSADEFFYQQTENFSTNQSTEISKEDIENKLRELLELNPDLTFSIVKFDDLKKLYRRAAMKFHPDVNGGDASKMTELNYYWQEWQKVRN